MDVEAGGLGEVQTGLQYLFLGDDRVISRIKSVA
jgi:hypothetical protein